MMQTALQFCTWPLSLLLLLLLLLVSSPRWCLPQLCALQS